MLRLFSSCEPLRPSGWFAPPRASFVNFIYVNSRHDQDGLLLYH